LKTGILSGHSGGAGLSSLLTAGFISVSGSTLILDTAAATG